MKKKKTIIYALVGAVIVLGLVISHYVDWPIEDDSVSGNIAKSSHFSRKTAEGGVENMQELLMNDENFKNGVVAGYIVMKTRAEQFNALVEMSAEVAGNIKEFESVLKEMKEVQPMIKNTCASIEVAGKEINSTLGGEAADDLEQNTSNATLAYNTLQKQNKLADQFIETVDSYLKKGNADDRLKFVRDQWLDYQQVTAALNQDENLAKELEKKGYLLSENNCVAALGAFNKLQQTNIICAASLSEAFNIGSALQNSVLTQMIYANEQFEVLNNVNSIESLKNVKNVETLNNGDKIATLDNGSKLEVLRNGDKIMTLECGVRIEALNNGEKLVSLDNGAKLEVLKNSGENIEVLSNGAKFETLKANELGVLGLSNFTALQGMPKLRSSVEVSMLNLSNINKMEMANQVNLVLNNQWNELQTLGAHYKTE
jgi:hypothetical protein